ncbi:MAG: TRL-like family protein [Treponema sp.]|jgi:hypothetical protein|nr:TRL-like family protein [Treponema sp.]
MKKICFVVLALALMSLAACSSITTPVMITDNPVGSKTGEVTATVSYIPLIGYVVTSGDSSLSSAAANGGITRIATVERRVETTPFSTKITTIVTGE